MTLSEEEMKKAFDIIKKANDKDLLKLLELTKVEEIRRKVNNLSNLFNLLSENQEKADNPEFVKELLEIHKEFEKIKK